MRDIICGTASFIAPMAIAVLAIRLRATHRRAKRQLLRRPTGLTRHSDFKDLPL